MSHEPKKKLSIAKDVVEKIRKDKTLAVLTGLRAGPSCPGGTGPCPDNGRSLS